jgi:hypothetical protein
VPPDPVPGEEALDADNDVAPVRGERIEEQLLVGRNLRLADDAPALIKDTDGKESGMQINAAVKLVLLVVEVHGVTPEVRVGA